MNEEHLEFYEDQTIRTVWDEEHEEWYFSVVDVVGVLTEQKDARGASTYWAVTKKRLKEEGANELLTNCKQLKMKAKDGKSGMSTRQYKNLKGLKKENLRDNMSTLELALNMLAEATTTELTNVKNPNGLKENQQVAKEGGKVAGNARCEIETSTGKPVITSQNAKQLQSAVVGMIDR